MAEVNPIHCDARGDVMLPHCWHVTHTLTVDPPIPIEQCCWCGESRHQPAMYYAYPPVTHGPHKK